MKYSKEFDFEVMAEEALVRQDKAKNILIGKFELKTESWLWHDRGNIAIEYASYGKPSGIAATKTDYWMHELQSREKETLAYIIFPTPILKKICNDEVKAKGRDAYRTAAGENQAQKIVLLKVEELLERLRNFEGKGDEEFVGQKIKQKKASRDIND